MMKTRHLLLLFVALLPIAAWADMYTQNGVNYEYDTSSGMASVSESFGASGDITILSSFTVGGKDYSVTSIGQSAFENCSGLTSVTIPTSVTSIGVGALWGCSGLTEITIPTSVTSIGSAAFQYCRGLTSVTIPTSVTSIGIGVFRYCTGLTSIVVESGNSVYDSRNNCNAIITTETNQLIAGCQKTVIPNSVTSIAALAFYNCSGLTSVIIGNSVTSIGEFAFSDCDGMKEVRSYIKEPFAINIEVFTDYTIPLYVPVGTKEKYQATEGWKMFTNIIEMEDLEPVEGDLNGDGKVNVGDIMAIINIMAGN